MAGISPHSAAFSVNTAAESRIVDMADGELSMGVT